MSSAILLPLTGIDPLELPLYDLAEGVIGSTTMSNAWIFSVVLTLAWGAGAFGSPYVWASNPLMVASVCLGAAGLWIGRRHTRISASLCLALLFLALAIGAQLVAIPRDQLARLSPHAIEILAQRDLTFSLGATLSHPLSIGPPQTWRGLAFFGSFSILLIGSASFLTRERAFRLAGAIAVLGVVLAVVGIVQQATFNGKIYGFWELVEGGAPFGPFINKNHFAGWLLMGLPVALGYFLALISRGMQGRQPGFRNLVLWFSTEHANHALLTGFAILIMALSLVMTMSRSGITSLAAALVMTGAVMVRRQSRASRRALVLGYLLFVVIAVVSWVGLDRIVARFAEMDITSINERPAIWADTIRIVNDFWFTGTGLNTYGVSTLFYQTAVPGSHLQQAHSDYLQLAAEGGLLLGLPIVLVILAFCWEVRRRLKQDVGSIWWIRMGAVTGLLAIALQSMVEFSLQMPGNAAMFAVVAGIAIHDGRRL